MMDFSKISQAFNRINKYVHRTPVLSSQFINSKVGKNIFFKCENFQKTGSFKARGALNAVCALKETNPSLKGVVTHSSGNHGQALAWAAKQMHFESCVVVPKNSSSSKMLAISSYGAELVICEPSPTARELTCRKIADELGYIIIPPYDSYDVIAGQGTMMLEFLEEVPELDAVIVPVSGGGMVSGIAIAAKKMNPHLKVYAATPQGKNLSDCLKTKKRLWPNPPQFLNSIADGIRIQQCGHLTFPIMCDLLEETVFEVSDDEMIKAMKVTWETLKVVIEVSSAVGVAAVLSNDLRILNSDLKNIGIILCGGNLDLDNIPWLTSQL